MAEPALKTGDQALNDPAKLFRQNLKTLTQGFVSAPVVARVEVKAKNDPNTSDDPLAVLARASGYRRKVDGKDDGPVSEEQQRQNEREEEYLERRAAETILSTSERISDWVNETIEEAQSAWEASSFKRTLDDVSDWASETGTKISNWANETWDSATEGVKSAFNSTVDGIKEFGTTVATKFNNAVDTVTATASNLYNEYVPQAVKNGVTAVAETASAIGDKAVALKDSAVETVSSGYKKTMAFLGFGDQSAQTQTATVAAPESLAAAAPATSAITNTAAAKPATPLVGEKNDVSVSSRLKSAFANVADAIIPSAQAQEMKPAYAAPAAASAYKPDSLRAGM